MISVSGDSWFLIILIVSLFIAFLLVFSFFYYLLKNKQQKNTTSPGVIDQRSAPVPETDVIRKPPEFSSEYSPDAINYSDISEEILAVRRKYSLDSLTVASHDGLVVMTSGSPSAESDAAYFAQRVVTGEEIEEDHVNVDTVEFRGTPLLIISRSRSRPSPDKADSIKNDIRRVLSDWL